MSAFFQRLYRSTLLEYRMDEFKLFWGQYLENCGRRSVAKKSGLMDNNSVTVCANQ